VTDRYRHTSLLSDFDLIIVVKSFIVQAQSDIAHFPLLTSQLALLSFLFHPRAKVIKLFPLVMDAPT
jgi:hypothetical protein